MDKNTLVPGKYRFWLFAFWLGAVIYVMSTEPTVLDAIGSGGFMTAFVVVMVIVANYMESENQKARENDPIYQFGNRLDNIERLLVKKGR